MKLSGKTILITGASTGIGRELARQLSRKQCRLLLVARRENLLQELCAELDGTHAQHSYFVCDVGDESHVEAVCQQIQQQNITIDTLILNAGVGGQVRAQRLDVNLIRKQFDVNFWGVIYFLKHLLPSMIQKRQGIIAVNSSMASYRGMPKSAPYSASKAAISTFIESMRVDLWKTGLQFTVISPGFVDTPMTEKNKFFMPFMIPVEKAVRIIIKGLERGKTEIRFPKPMVTLSILGKWLPDKWWVHLMHSRR